MLKLVPAALFTLGSLLASAVVTAQTSTRDLINTIEQEYARQSNGQMIPDTQLEYYLDRAHAGWTSNQISQDMANSQSQYGNSPWLPQSGWVPREVVCTSDGSQYRECAAPFQGRAVVTQQISQSACIEGRSWGQRPGVIWVNQGCRARFGIVAGSDNGYPGNGRMIYCQSNKGEYRECDTRFRGPVALVSSLNNSSACTLGQTWGQVPGRVWVGNGCRAQFREINGGAGGNWDNNYSINCSSTGGAAVQCNWDSRYGSPRLQKQLSQNACIEGRTWGYDGRGILWVNQGCRGQFGTR